MITVEKRSGMQTEFGGLPLTLDELDEFARAVRAAGAAGDTPVSIELDGEGRPCAVSASFETASETAGFASGMETKAQDA
jgi:hypothetical protein